MHVARRMWRQFEPVHAITYFAPECIEQLAAAGLKGFWMGYFAGRSAPMGAVEPAVVEATFYNFAPRLVRRAIPDAWGFATTSAVLDARIAGVSAVLTPLCTKWLPPDRQGELVTLLYDAIDGLTTDGRPLAAANAAIERPDDPVSALWQAVTVLREHRGDGHVAALVDAELSGLEAHLTLVATGAIGRSVLQPARGWSDDEWAAADERLRSRGLLQANGDLSDAGAALRREVETRTDELATEPWTRLGDKSTTAVVELLTPLARAVGAAGLVPALNPIGLDLEGRD